MCASSKRWGASRRILLIVAALAAVWCSPTPAAEEREGAAAAAKPSPATQRRRPARLEILDAQSFTITEQVRISGGERYAEVYNIDYNRCIFCGYCVEACPTDAITHGHGFELAAYDTSALIMRKEDMLVALPPNAKPVVIQGAPRHGGH